MANPADVLMQLQTKMFAKQVSKKADVDIDEGGTLDEDQAAKRFIGHYVRRGQGEYKRGDRRDVVDVDDLNAGEVDDDYVTYRPMSLPYDNSVSYGPHKLGFEQLKYAIEQAVGQSPEEVGAQAAGGNPMGGAIDTPEEMGAQAAGQIPGAEPGPDPAMDPSMAGMDPGMGQPVPEADTSKTPSDLGRLYELKKIYTRLTVIEAYLAESSDITLIETRGIVSKAIELFEILSSNFSSFKPPRATEETLDEIIVQYYRFLENVYGDVAKYYKKTAREQKQNEDEPPDTTNPPVKINIYTPV